MTNDERLVFETELAMKIGLNESIVLEILMSCVKQSHTLMDGKRWVRHTYEDWLKVFPFWSKTTIKRILQSLQKQGYILIEQYGKHSYDRANWYAIAKGEHATNKEDKTSTDAQNQTTEALNSEVQEKYILVEKRLKELQFYPLKDQQKEELANICHSYSAAQIITALEETASKGIYAWKYAYKVLITSTNNRPAKRRTIRKEMVPEWFETRDKKDEPAAQLDEDLLEKRRRMEAIQAKYRKKEAGAALA